MNVLGFLKRLKLIDWIIAAVLVGLVLAIIIGSNHRINALEGQKTYQVWCKVYNRQDLTYEEWLVARRAGYFIDHHVARP